jgi:hypothetical protein
MQQSGISMKAWRVGSHLRVNYRVLTDRMMTGSPMAAPLFWLALTSQLVIVAGYFWFYRKEQLGTCVWFIRSSPPLTLSDQLGRDRNIALSAAEHGTIWFNKRTLFMWRFLSLVYQVLDCHPIGLVSIMDTCIRLSSTLTTFWFHILEFALHPFLSYDITFIT